MKLEGKVAIVSGSGRGIGREIAVKLAAEGARVVVNDLDREPAAETVAAIEAAGGEALACVGSVTDDGFAERFVAEAVDGFGGLDIIVNNAGYTWDNVIQKMADEQWDAMHDVHVKAPFRVLRAAQPYIRANPVDHHRKVVNISSVSGIGGHPGQANYSSAKAAVIGLTKALSKEWGRLKVNVNAVAFGLIETRLTVAVSGAETIEVEGRQIKVGISTDFLAASTAMIPLGRAGSPAEAAGAVYLLCLPESDYISGQVVVCGGGLSV
ncbi:3-oxoacyl-[acyl-carrier protein] reductase [Streptosporangium becharense]|uniref:3-oxoacyl-[acyl-carrier protein] reductase n=1 Tax=Streptosporangium becharense TaxID=1816182 RepID=A0A7W9IJ45_9ACTN|nr:SDR family oxidoreductase [Streptosporangium becharense]MBB2911239.1 3-oxoacyl-[acyl-carrier protein] reductase [Streptosporangium becharense]MBB5821703.1 3-oxoacyl-[acyl-carrier protein] reductase [Streptosporangium becharense]